MKAALFFALLTITALHAQEPGAQTETLHVTAREVVLDIVATDKKGHSLHGLTANDFIVSEDGVPLKIKNLAEHTAMSAEDLAAQGAPPQLPSNTFTSFYPENNTNATSVILIDALDTPTDAQMYLRQEVMAFLKSAPRGYRFAIFLMDTRMHLVQGMTSDPAALLKAVESKRDMVELGHSFHGIELDHVRDELLNSGLQVMARYLAGFDGRKNLIWFTSYVPKSVYSLKANPFRDAVDYNMLSNRPANAQSLSRVNIYPIDGRGLEVDHSHFSDHDEMERVAAATGGKAYHSRNDLKEALQEITDTSSNYYTLSYTPVNPVWRAHHRNVQITLANKLKGATLLYRHAYFGMTERKAQRIADAKAVTESYTPTAAPPSSNEPNAELLREVSKLPFDASMELGSVPSGELLFQVTAAPAAAVIKPKKDEPLPKDNYLRGPLATKPYREYHLAFAVDPSRVIFSRTSDGVFHGRIDYATLVYADTGEVANGLRSTSTITLDEKSYLQVLQSNRPLRMEQTIAIPTQGDYFLHMGVHDLTGDLVGTVEVPVDTISKPR